MQNTFQIIPTTVAGKSYILLGLTKQKNINNGKNVAGYICLTDIYIWKNKSML